MSPSGVIFGRVVIVLGDASARTPVVTSSVLALQVELELVLLILYNRGGDGSVS